MTPDTLSDELRRRQFLLSLSVKEGQTLASLLGFTPPSVDVQQIEETDVLRQMVQLGAVGVLSSIQEAAEWFSGVLKVRIDLDEQELKNAFNVFLSFTVAVVMKLVSEDLVYPKHDVEVVFVREDV
jgi:hypothetical protein